MGVKNLWDILESCKKTLPLHHLQNKRVCIDLSCWIVQLQTASKNHSSIKDKVYLRTLFHRLRALLSLNCSLIFVSDGSIPAIKLTTYRRRLGSNCEVARDEINSHKVSSLTRNMGSDFSCMIKEAKVLAMALGIPCLDGVEEAEAQCALLNSESLCDGCFSSDSDIFLFGAKTVYRDMYLGEGGHVVCYEMVDIEQKLGYGRNSLITLALLLGSDYSQGVHGLGPGHANLLCIVPILSDVAEGTMEKAGQIVKSIGDDVILQQVASEGLAFVNKMKGSKKHGKVLKSNKENSLVHEQKDIVNAQHPLQDDQFLQVINAYLTPKCHSPDSEDVHRVLGPHPFQRSKLQQVCAESFGWTPEKTDEYILPKIGERDLRRFANLRSASSGLGVLLPMDKMPVTCPITSIIKQRKVQGKDCFEVAWDHLDGLTSSIVPADLIESACPEMIVEFKERGAEGKKRSHRTRANTSDNKAAQTEVDLKLQALMLDIETESHAASATAICSKHPIVPSYAATEIIDLLSPSPPIRARKVSNCRQITSTQIEVINICDSETDISPPEHERKSRAEILSSQVVTTIFLDD